MGQTICLSLDSNMPGRWHSNFLCNLHLQVNTFLNVVPGLTVRHNELYSHADDKEQGC